MSRIARVRRTTGTIAAFAVLLSGALAGGADSATAALTDNSGVFFACPDVATLTTISTPTCSSLSGVLAGAQAWSASHFQQGVIIDLLPGKYCPIDIAYDPYAIKFQGLGIEGLADPTDFDAATGFEAELSEFTWMSGGTCGASAPSAYIRNELNPDQPGEQTGALTFENLSVIAGSGGPNDGLDITSNETSIQDIVVSGVPGTGVVWGNSADFYGVGVQRSAIINNGNGVNIGANFSRGGGLDADTIAYNTGIGVAGSSIGALSDTIVHNGTGIIGSDLSQLGTSIVGDNGTNCSGQPTQDAGENVLGSGCALVSGDSPDVDQVHATGALTTGGQITPSIAPPSEAAGNPTPGVCELNGIDQEHDVLASGDQCWSGSILPDETFTAPAASEASHDFGGVPTNEAGSAGFYFSGIGGLATLGPVDIENPTGTGAFTVAGDNCSYTVLTGSYCQVYVTATAGDANGSESTADLVFHASTGDVTVPVSMTGAPAITAPDAPTNLQASIGDPNGLTQHYLNFSWTPTPDGNAGGQPVQSYEIDDSTDGGSTWNSVDTSYDTTDNPVVVDGQNVSVVNNKTYEFRVLAYNGLLTSTSSSDIVSLTPLGTATSIARPPLATFTWGSSLPLRTKLTSGSTPVAGVSVHLQRNIPGTATWTTEGSATTAADGTASVTATAKQNAPFRWLFTGTSKYAPSVSTATTIKVAQAVTAALSASTVHHKNVVKVYGIVLPNARNQKVTIQGKKASAHAYVTLGTAKLVVQKLPNGKKVLGYLFSYKPSAKGKIAIRVTKAATSINAAGTSNVVQLKVT